ncbi:hypothetical protein G9A89_022404 [Geosiphon pyriformis]|nr:hypothetical protein G9A89_022404 [Geosiphon pyriformis]
MTKSILQTIIFGPPRHVLKEAITSKKSLALGLRPFAAIANYGYCMPQKNIFGELARKDGVVAHGGIFMPNSHSSSNIYIYFKGKTLTKSQWISRQSILVPFRHPDLETESEPFNLVDQEWLEDILRMWHLIVKEIDNVLEMKKFEVSKIYFIGHAIGGAYATLAGQLFSIRNDLDIIHKRVPFQVITFGAPKVGNEFFAKSTNLNKNRLIRVTHGNDHVPHFPIGTQGIMFHSNPELWIKPISKDCNCGDNNNNNNNNIREEYYICRATAINRKSLICNASQTFSNVSDNFVHQGPYFGILMNNCEGFGDFYFQGFEHANHGYCTPEKNIFGKEIEKEDTLTKSEWLSREPILVPFRYPGLQPEHSALVDQEWLQDILKIWPVIIEKISMFIDKFGQLPIDDIYLIGHAIGGGVYINSIFSYSFYLQKIFEIIVKNSLFFIAYAILASQLWEIYIKKLSNIHPKYEQISLRVITFGAPRVGNKHFARLTNRNINENYRITYGNDHVPHFPINIPGIMEHSKNEIWIKPIENNCDCDNWGNNKTELVDEAEYYLCYGNNQDCNNGQSLENIADNFINRGPYFGHLMGECQGFQAFNFQGFDKK